MAYAYQQWARACSTVLLYQPQGVQAHVLQSSHVRLVKRVHIAFRNPRKLLHDNVYSVKVTLSSFGIEDAVRLGVHVKDAVG